MKSLLLLFSLSTLIHLSNTATVIVDPDNGDDENCLSVRELISTGLTNSTIPCQTLNYALSDNQTDYYSTANCSDAPFQYNNVRILLSDGQHGLTSQLELVQSANITIEAINTGRATIECVDFPNYQAGNFDNFFACQVSGLRFMGVVFQRCGPVPSNVFIYNCSDVYFDRCTFRGNTGSSLQLRYVTNLTLTHTTFEQNNNNATPTTDRNETSIEDLYNIIQTSGGLTYIAGLHRINVLIDNCTFIGNRASRNEPNDSRPVLLKPNGHGGAMLVRLSGTYKGSFVIRRSRFIDNSAEVDGGAIYITYSDKATNNTISIEESIFEGNSVVEAAGGGVSINSFNFTLGNRLEVIRCMFSSNSGSAGGAMSIALYDSNSNSTEYPDSVLFTACEFMNNSAINEGTAVGLFSLVHVDQVGFLVNFVDCHFDNNTSIERDTGQTGDTSALAAFRFPLRFEGRNTFINNTGGGIMLLNTRMKALGSMLFKSNRAVVGGGIMMDDRCLLEITPHSRMDFIGNEVSESGGGIYVEFPPIRFVIDIFNRLCFLQYSDDSGTDIPPQDWNNVSISFINNSARLSGAAIYASDMERCAWLGGNYSNIDSRPIFKFPPELDERSPFHYSNNTVGSGSGGIVIDEELATAPIRLHPIVRYDILQSGERLAINLSATDQLNNTREAVWSLQAPGEQSTLGALSANNDTFIYTVPPLSLLYNDTLSLNFSLLKTLGITSQLNSRVRGCHPGYSRNSSTDPFICICDINHNIDILRCDTRNRYVYLRRGVWGGVDPNDDSRLITTRVSPGYIQCDQQGRLPGCLFKFDEPERQCQDGRTGALCGQCLPERGVTLNLRSCTSVSCYYGLALFIIFSCVGIGLFCSVILWFDIMIPNELRGFLFYAQVIGLVYQPFSVANTQSGSVDATAVIVNLLGLSVPLPLCISRELGAEHVALLGYIPPLIMLTACIIFVIGTRFIKPLAHHSAIRGITCLMFFFYKYLADTTLVFLSCNSTPLGFVFQYDGSVKCFSAFFGVFFILALLTIIFVIGPLPFGVSYVATYRGPQIFKAFADVLTDGIRCHRKVWAGWDIGRRFVFVFIGFFVAYGRPSLILFIMAIAALLVFIVHIIVRPYSKEYINVIEALILLDLVLVTGAFLDPTLNTVTLVLGYILVFLPFVYGICFFIWLFGYNIIWPKIKGKIKSEDITLPSQEEGQEGTSKGHGLLPNNTGRDSTSSSSSPSNTNSSGGTTTARPTSSTALSTSTDVTKNKSSQNNSTSNVSQGGSSWVGTGLSGSTNTYYQRNYDNIETTVELREPMLDELF